MRSADAMFIRVEIMFASIVVTQSVKTLCSGSKDHVLLLERRGGYNVHSLKYFPVENHKIILLTSSKFLMRIVNLLLLMLNLSISNGSRWVILVFLKQHRNFSVKSCESTMTCRTL